MSKAEKSAWNESGPNLIIQGDNLSFLRSMPSESIDLIYIDPPFNTGKKQARTSYKSTRQVDGNRVGFKGQTYSFVRERVTSYNDAFDDYWSFLEPRLEEAWRILKPNGTLYLHLDYREVHYAKVLLDALFGRESFLNEIIWAYDYGARSKSKWPTKHDNKCVL